MGNNRRSCPNREICFGFVSCSRRACERAGEAKLCGCAREQCSPALVPRTVRCVAAPAPATACAFSFLLLCSWLFNFFARIADMLVGFLIFLVFDGMFMVFYCFCIPCSLLLLCSWVFYLFSLLMVCSYVF